MNNTLPKTGIRCDYCERLCRIPEGKCGFCGMYTNNFGKIIENYPDSYLNIYPVSSESIPMIHFYPNNSFLLISTINCNFSCKGCISEFQTIRPGKLQEVLTYHTPEEILNIAKESDCIGITFCLNEPSVSFPTFLRVAEEAKKRGFLVGCSSNGYMTEKTLNCLIPYLDFVNIGIKGSTDERYLECGVSSAAPVFRNIKLLFESGVSVEVSVMFLKGREEEVLGAARFITSISTEIPFQIMRFMPTKDDLDNLGPDKGESEALCTELNKYLKQVYLFNTPAAKILDSRCPECGNVIIHRVFFGPMASRILSYETDGICKCGYKLPFIGHIKPIPDDEQKVLGGYRSIMGAKYVVDLFFLLGIKDENEVNQLSNTVISNGYLSYIQEQQDSLSLFSEIIRYLAELSGRKEKGEYILRYVDTILHNIEEKIPTGKKPDVLAVFCHPLSPTYASKFTNTMVEMAGGESLNKRCGFKESSNAEYQVEEFNRLDPEIILVTGPTCPSGEEFIGICRDLGISCRAITNGKVYSLTFDFASGILGWIIQLMDIANSIHPEIFNYSLRDEKERMDAIMDAN